MERRSFRAGDSVEYLQKAKRLRVSDTLLEITNAEYILLQALINSPNKIVKKDLLVETFNYQLPRRSPWQRDDVSQRVFQLRKKLFRKCGEQARDMIALKTPEGYMFNSNWNI